MSSDWTNPCRNSAAAVPFPGRFAAQTFPPDPLAVAKTLVNADRELESLAYLRRYLEIVKLHREDVGFDQYQPDVIDQSLIACYQRLAEEAIGSKQFNEAAVYAQELLARAADDGARHRHLAMMLMQANQPRLALPHFQIAVQTLPDDARLFFNAGLAHIAVRDTEGAIRLLKILYRPRSK